MPSKSDLNVNLDSNCDETKIKSEIFDDNQNPIKTCEKINDEIKDESDVQQVEADPKKEAETNAAIVAFLHEFVKFSYEDNEEWDGEDYIPINKQEITPVRDLLQVVRQYLAKKCSKLWLKVLEEFAKVKELFPKRDYTWITEDATPQLREEDLPDISHIKFGPESTCCRICGRSEGPNLMFNPCKCVGESAFIHRGCLHIWFQRARYDVLCCDCKDRYSRIKYRQCASFRYWLQEDKEVRNHVLAGVITFPVLFVIAFLGIIKAGMHGSSQIFKVLFIPTTIFGFLTVWKFLGSVAVIMMQYRRWRAQRLYGSTDQNQNYPGSRRTSHVDAGKKKK